MFCGKTVIDVHGHMSTPPQFRAFAYNLIALRTPGDELVLSQAQLQGPIDRHLRMLDSHNIDVQLISPRPVAMMHWVAIVRDNPLRVFPLLANAPALQRTAAAGG